LFGIWFRYEFEEKVKYKQKADSNITFEAFTKQYLENYAELQLAPKTVERYKSLFRRINIAIGHIKLEKLQIGHLADLYSQLGESKNQQGASFIATEEFLELLNKNYTRVKVAEKTGLGINAIYNLYKQKPISSDCCDKIAKVLRISFKKNFTNPRVEGFLSNKTIKHHHSLISAVLNKAVEWQVKISFVFLKFSPLTNSLINSFGIFIEKFLLVKIILYPNSCQRGMFLFYLHNFFRIVPW
jgi:hypothetical protein